MAQHSAQEQLMLELINHARLDPAAEARRLGVSLNDGLQPGTINSTSKAPLAANFYLEDAASGHSRWMLDNGIFSHTGAGGSSAAERMYDAGYRFTGSWAWGENISARSLSTASDASATAIYNQHKSLFLSAGHRANILSEKYAEVGIGQVRGYYGGSTNMYSMVTQNFAKSGNTIFVTGVIYNDLDGDNFYSVGEGVANLDLRGGALWTESLSAGGYQIPIGTGIQTIMLGTAVLRATIVGENAKIDLVDAVRVDASVSIELVSGIRQAKLLGLDNLSLTGSTGNDTLTGNKGNNTIKGGSGADTVRGADGNDKLHGDTGNDKLYGGNGDDDLYGGAGNDTLYGDAGRDYLSGSTGSDKLYGGSGADTLLGGDGNDLLDGGSSVDHLTGGLGADTLTGGTGADHFIFNSIKDSTVASTGRDTITDFSRSELDRIDLSAIDASTRTTGNQAFKFVGTDAFSGAAGELRYVKTATTTTVYGDINGDGQSDFAIKFDDALSLRASDFIL